MNRFLLSVTATFMVAGLAAADQAAPATQSPARVPHPTKVTFYIANVQCAKCVDAITESVKKVPTVTAVDGLTPNSGYAVVSFDSHASSFHQVAQAIADAAPQHGKKYEPTIRVQVPDYAQGDNAAKVDEVFQKRAKLISVETTDKQKGLFTVHFLPLKVNPAKPGPQGFNGGMIGHPIHDPAPKGLGLNFHIVNARARKAG